MWGILLCFRGTLGEISGEKMLMIEKEMQLSDRNAALLPGGDVSRAGSRLVYWEPLAESAEIPNNAAGVSCPRC